MTDKFKKIIPIGVKPQTEMYIVTASFLLSVCRALLFYLNYNYWYNSLFEFRNGQKILIAGKAMAYFHTVADRCFDGFIISFFIFLFLIFFHYGYHYKDSKSIYTMKRLPDKNELHIRCLTLPVICILVSIALSFLLLLLFYHHYITVTPPECLPPDQWKMFWTHLIYKGEAL